MESCSLELQDDNHSQAHGVLRSWATFLIAVALHMDDLETLAD